jgi:hypothetical protein
MPFKDSRLGPGTLLIGTAPGTDYGVQVSACTLTPAVDSTDGTPTLAVPEPPPLTSTTYTLDGTAVNDFTAPAGFQRYCFDNDGLETDFTYTPNTVDAAVLTGMLTVRAFPMGGNVGEQITTDFSFPITGKPVWTGGAAATAAEAETRKMAKR